MMNNILSSIHPESTVAATIAPSFEFHSLSYQSKVCRKPLLAQVTGEINNGQFWGLMGAPGAGESTFVSVLTAIHSHAGGVTKINGSAGISYKCGKVIVYNFKMSWLVDLVIGTVASSPGVKICGEEESMYYRAASSGHDRFALPRIVP